MADDRRTLTRPKPNALVASARLLTDRRIDNLPPPEGWQDEFWTRYDDTPEVRFACGYLESAGTRVRLLAAKRGSVGDEPEVIEDGVAADLMEALAGGTEGQSQMMGDFFVHLAGPGKCYLVGEPSGTPDGETAAADTWQVCSLEELRVDRSRSNTTGTGTRYELRTGDSERDWRPLAEDALVCEVWRSHKRRKWKPDSPHRATLGVLRELRLMTQHVEAAGVSRLAGAGILLLPKEVVFPTSDASNDAEDPFLAELTQAMVTPITNRDSAAAVVPFPVQMPGEFVDKVKHLTFDTPLDERAIALREEAIRRYATGVDLPAEVVTGLGDVNHWTGWQIEESALKLHIEPMSEATCLAITRGYLQPALRALGTTDPDIICWYDTTNLKVRPDRSGDAKDVYDRKAISVTALRRETGFDESDAPDDAELREQILVGIVTAAPSLAPIILPLLGIDIPTEVQQLSQGIDPEAPPAPPSTPPAQGPPPTRDEPPPPPGEVPAVAAAGEPRSEAGLLAACDGLVVRALERAGARLTNAARKAGITLSGSYDTRHVAAPSQLVIAECDTLLDEAWARVPVIAERYGVEPLALETALDDYTRATLLGGLPHEFDRLADVLGATQEAA